MLLYETGVILGCACAHMRACAHAKTCTQNVCACACVHMLRNALGIGN